MIRCVVDTNVPIVANGRPDPSNGGRVATVDCRTAAVSFLQRLLESGRLLIDHAGEIQGEYRRHLCPSGQPGVGDRFYLEVLNSSPQLIERVDLPKREDGEHEDLPQALIDAGFDPSDRKFAALAKREGVPVYNTTDSDWLTHRKVLEASEIAVEFLCTPDSERWFAT